MFIKPTKPIKVTTRKGAVLMKSHHVVKVADAIGKKLVTQNPPIRQVAKR